ALHISPAHAPRRLTRPKEREHHGHAAESGPNREERPHETQSAADDRGTEGEPGDAEAESPDPTRGPDSADEREPRWPLRPGCGLHDEDRPHRTARSAKTADQEVRQVELGQRPARGHEEEAERVPR